MKITKTEILNGLEFCEVCWKQGVNWYLDFVRELEILGLHDRGEVIGWKSYCKIKRCLEEVGGVYLCISSYLTFFVNQNGRDEMQIYLEKLFGRVNLLVPI